MLTFHIVGGIDSSEYRIQLEHMILGLLSTSIIIDDNVCGGVGVEHALCSRETRV